MLIPIILQVWTVGLIFFYCGNSSQSKIGEEWSNWSFLELFGFGVLLYGTFAYKALVKMPCVDGDIYELAIQDEEDVENKNKNVEEKYDKGDKFFNT